MSADAPIKAVVIVPDIVGEKTLWRVVNRSVVPYQVLTRYMSRENADFIADAIYEKNHRTTIDTGAT